VRAGLEREAEDLGWRRLHGRLAAIDPAAARRIHPNDPQRIQRALEVHVLTGRPLSALQGRGGEPNLPYRVLKIARAPRDRRELHRRIAERFRRMLEQGLEEEVRALLARGDVTSRSPALRSVGYRQVLQHLGGAIDRATLIERGIIATRQLAKRQLTWLRGEPEVRWLHDEDGDPRARALRWVQTWIETGTGR
jgi:tRNA dimethylallyltransferase